MLWAVVRSGDAYDRNIFTARSCRFNNKNLLFAASRTERYAGERQLVFGPTTHGAMLPRAVRREKSFRWPVVVGRKWFTGNPIHRRGGSVLPLSIINTKAPNWLTSGRQSLFDPRHDKDLRNIQIVC